MSDLRMYLEDDLALSNSNEHSQAGRFSKMNASMKKVGLDLFRNAQEISKNPEYMKMLTESAKIAPTSNASKYVLQDITRTNTLFENIGAEMLNEATATVANISPIMMNSFGIQERALISAHLPRAVKQVAAKIDNFKLTERIPFIVDLAGNKRKFIDAFVPDENGNAVQLSLSDTVTMGFACGATDVDLYAGSGTEVDADDPDYRPVVTTNNVFGYDSAVDSLVITATKGFASSASDTATTAKVTFTADSLRSPNVEDGTFRLKATWSEWDSADSYRQYDYSAVIMGQFDFSNGKLVSLVCNNSKVTYVKFKMVLSPETHNKALSVGYDVKHTPVNIPIGEHFEYSLSEEFKDASDKYYNTDAMALLTDYMGKAVEQVKDIKTLEKYQELAKGAILKVPFNCDPSSGFSQGKEEYIRREFLPFVEKVCILLKNKVRTPNCHFRVLGNPLDIRVAASAGTEYIYKRNEQFAGEIGIDYEFSVTSDIHKIFYLSSERVPAGQALVFLIPNTIENNISTVNFYEYATYVSNKYKGTNTNLPTVMISTRYLCKEYFPVMAVIDIVNNLVTDDSVTVTGTGFKDAIYKKVQYVNA